ETFSDNDYLPIFKQLGAAIEERGLVVDIANDMIIDVLRPIVMRSEVSEKMIVFDKTKVSDLIAAGAYTVSPSGASTMKLKFPSIFVYGYGRLVPELANVLIPWIETDASSDGLKFEEFHGYWECFHRHFRQNEYYSLPEIYPNAIHCSKDIQGLTFKNFTGRMVKARNLREAFNHHCSKKDNSSDIYHIGGNNCGFDSVHFTVSNSGEKIALCWVMRYSQETSSTSVGWDTVERKFVYTVEDFNKHDVPHKVVFIYTAYGNISGNLSEKLSEKGINSVFVLNRQSLNKLYGPFTHRASLY
ncbi:hypothetical protein ROZALSC1DRAFT_22610, partial [Rozella allomycis CSF55]